MTDHVQEEGVEVENLRPSAVQTGCVLTVHEVVTSLEAAWVSPSEGGDIFLDVVYEQVALLLGTQRAGLREEKEVPVQQPV